MLLTVGGHPGYRSTERKQLDSVLLSRMFMTDVKFEEYGAAQVAR